MKKILLVFITLLFLLFPKTVFAEDQFRTYFRATYEVKSNGIMQVNYNISITNQFSNVYVSSYQLSFDSQELEKIYANDSTGPIKINKTKKDSKTIIDLAFNDQTVGVNETLNFNFGYQTKSLSKKTGQIWEISIPRQLTAKDFDSFDLTLKVPTSFGVAAYVSPQAKEMVTKDSFQLYHFDKEQISDSGIVAAFGKFQLFDFDLDYHLISSSQNEGETSIALPPDTNYQKVNFQSLFPKPLRIEVDKDGNWLAFYKLKAQEKILVKLSGQVQIFADPISFYKPHGFDLNDYLKPQDFWEVNSPQIKDLAKKYKTPEEIYDYVVSALNYDPSRAKQGAKRLGALGVLDNSNQALCTEFTDLFIAISRAAGIPSREINGYAYTNDEVLQPLSENQDALHAWPEYWDVNLKKWIQIDPTWQKTTGGVDYFSKLDLGHFTMVIHGQNSHQPYPASAYKQDPAIKNITINFGTYKEPRNGFKGTFNLKKHLYAERTTNAKFIIENIGNEALYDLPFKIEHTEDINIVSPKEGVIGVIPPMASYEIPLKIASSKLTLERSSEIKIIVKNLEFKDKFIVSSLFLSRILPALLICGGLAGIILNVKRILKIFRKK